MKILEIKPCVQCGQYPNLEFVDGIYICRCSNRECPTPQERYTISNWNNRDLVRELKEEIESLRSQLDNALEILRSKP